MLCEPDILHENFEQIIKAKKQGSSSDLLTIDHNTRVMEFKKHIRDLECKMNNMESKYKIELPATVHAHNLECHPIGRKDDGMRMLYMNLLCECTDNNKQKGGNFFVI